MPGDPMARPERESFRHACMGAVCTCGADGEYAEAMARYATGLEERIKDLEAMQTQDGITQDWRWVKLGESFRAELSRDWTRPQLLSFRVEGGALVFRRHDQTSPFSTQPADPCSTVPTDSEGPE